MDENRLAKVAKNGKHHQASSEMTSKILMPESDINVTGGQANTGYNAGYSLTTTTTTSSLRTFAHFQAPIRAPPGS
jgi:hypothetical protein